LIDLIVHQIGYDRKIVSINDLRLSEYKLVHNQKCKKIKIIEIHDEEIRQIFDIDETEVDEEK